MKNRDGSKGRATGKLAGRIFPMISPIGPEHTLSEGLQLIDDLHASFDRTAQVDRIIEAAQRIAAIETPFGAYKRWSSNGNTEDADRLQRWEDARLELEQALAAAGLM